MAHLLFCAFDSFHRFIHQKEFCCQFDKISQFAGHINIRQDMYLSLCLLVLAKLQPPPFGAMKKSGLWLEASED
jgi:hypothetical protein